MAQQSNNDYLIRIKGDASGLTKALDDVKKKFEETDRLVERYKAQIKDAQKANLPGIGKLTADMKGLITQYQSNRREVANTAKEMVSQQKAIDKLVEKINAQKRVLDSTIDKFVDYRHAEQKLKDEQASQAAVVDKLREKVESLKSVLNDKDRSGLRSGAIIPDLLKAERELENAERKYQKITDAVNAAELKTQKYENIVGSQNEKLTQLEISLDNAKSKYAQLAQSISGAGDRMNETMSALEQHSANLGVGEEMARLASDIAAFQKQMNSGISEFGKTTPEFSAYSSSVAGLKSELEDAANSFIKLDNTSDTYDSDLEKLILTIVGLENRFKGLTSAYPELSKQIEKSGAVYATQAEQAEKLNAAITALGNKISGLGKKMAGNVAKGAKNFAKSLGDIASKAIQTRKEGSTLNSITQKLGHSFNRLGSIAKRMLARMALRAVFNNIGQAMKDLALQFADFNSAMSGMGASANQLTAQIVAAFSPLIQAIAPIVNSLIGMITNLMNSITQLFAILGGQASWRKAIKTTYDYSGAMDAAGGSAASARKEAEELERQLFSFDEINKLNMPKETDTSSGGGGGGGASADESQFRWVEETLPKNDLTEWAKKLSDAFTSHDWKTLGKTVAEGVNAAFEWIKNIASWENAGDKIKSIIGAITTTFNTFVETTDWKNIGSTFGSAVTTILKTALELEEGINWEGIGEAIADSINGVFEELSFSDIADVVVGKINAALKTLGSFSDRLDRTGIGDNLGAGLSKALEDFDWADAGEAISSFVTGLFDALVAFVGKVDWKAFGEGIAKMLEKIKWGEILAGVVKLIVGVFTGITTTIGSIFDELTKDPHIKELESNIQGLADNLDDLQDRFEETKTEYSTQKEYVNDLITKIDELSEAGDTTKAKEAIDELIKKWPELEQFLNDEGTGFNTASDAVRRHANALLDNAMIQNLLTQQEEAQSTLKELQDQAKQTAEEVIGSRAFLNQTKDEAWTAYQNALNGGATPEVAWETYQATVSSAEKRYNDAVVAHGKAIEKMNEADVTYANITRELESYTVEIDNNTSALDTNTGSIDDNTEANKANSKSADEATSSTEEFNEGLKTTGDTAEEQGGKIRKAYGLDLEEEGETAGKTFNQGTRKPNLPGLAKKTSNEVVKEYGKVDLTTGGTKAANSFKTGMEKPNLPLFAKEQGRLIDYEFGTIDLTTRGSNSGNSYKTGMTKQDLPAFSREQKRLIDYEFGTIDLTEKGGHSGNTYKAGMTKQDLPGFAKEQKLYITNRFGEIDLTNSGSNSGSTYKTGLTRQDIPGGAKKIANNLISIFGIDITDKGKNTGKTFNTGLSGQDIPGKVKAIATTVLSNMGIDLGGKGENASKTFVTGFNKVDIVSKVKAAVDKVKSELGIDLTGGGQTIGQTYGAGVEKSITIDGPAVRKKLANALDFDLSYEGKNVGNTFGGALKKAIENTYIKTPTLKESGKSTITNGDGTTQKVPTYKVDWYASGGFPDMGELFIAREKGPELVGTIGNRNAVVNNRQIVESVTNGVSKGVAEAMALNGNGNNRSGDIVIRIGNEEIYRMSRNGERRYNKRVSPMASL